MPYSWLSDELFDRVPVAICVIDQDFRVVEANARFTELYGEWIGHRCYQVYKDRTERCVRCGAAKTFEDGKAREREEEGVDRRGRPHHYLVDIVHASRSPEEYGLGIKELIAYGASPRATICLNQAARGHAFLRGRGYVTPEDVRSIVMDVLRHRIIVTYEAEAEDVTSEMIVQRILDAIEVP